MEWLDSALFEWAAGVVTFVLWMGLGAGLVSRALEGRGGE